MNVKFKFVICALLLFFPARGLAETIYNQPYLGEFPRFFRDRFSVLALKRAAENNLAAIVQQSDLIVLAESEKLDESVESSDRFTVYDTNVKILKTFKGKPKSLSLHLRFRAFTTGIEKGAKHIFFLKKTEKGTEVLKSSYIFPGGQGYDNHMRLFGALDCSEDVGVDIIRYLAILNIPINIEERLINEYLNQDAYSAVHMAAATAPVIGNSLLKMVVSVKDKKRFDIDLYGIAAYKLAIQQRYDFWQTILENIPSIAGNGRVAESMAFDLVATFGDENLVPLIKEIVSKNPEIAVSAAFALAKIKGKEAKSLIEFWLKDPKLSQREEIISSGWSTLKTSFSTLFREALEIMDGVKDRSIFTSGLKNGKSQSSRKIRFN